MVKRKESVSTACLGLTWEQWKQYWESKGHFFVIKGQPISLQYCLDSNLLKYCSNHPDNLIPTLEARRAAKAVRALGELSNYGNS